MLLQTHTGGKSTLLKSLEYGPMDVLFDLYSGHNVEKGYKSLAISLILQDVSCNLTGEVADSVVQNVVQGLETRLDAQLRG